MNVDPYFPPFLWTFWLRAASTYNTSSTKPPTPSHLRLNVYDSFTNELSEVLAPPRSCPDSKPQSAFADLLRLPLDRRTLARLHVLQEQLAQFEIKAETAMSVLVNESIRYAKQGTYKIPFNVGQAGDLRKYIAFLHFRNGPLYQRLVEEAQRSSQGESGLREAATGLGDDSVPLSFILEAIMIFLKLTSRHRVANFCIQSGCRPGQKSHEHEHKQDVYAHEDNIYLHELHNLCWQFAEGDLSVGRAEGGDHEYVLSDNPLGMLDESFDALPGTCNVFLPVAPHLAIYVLGDPDPSPPPPPPSSFSPSSSPPPKYVEYIQIFPEAQIDVHLRNAFILHTAPRRLYFASLRSVALSVSSYDEFRRTPGHKDHSRLKQRCRQRYLQETVAKTLVIRDARVIRDAEGLGTGESVVTGVVVVTDLTEEVTLVGPNAVAHGSFSDVWKGMWADPVEHRPRFVALKLLRQIMANNIREKLLQRLSSEVAAWHRLCHRHVAQFLGIYQTPTTLGMVSPWCDNGTVQHFLRNNGTEDRPTILAEIASGVDYLHNFKPVIIHGDLKSGNILIDHEGKPLLTDFGLSMVLDDVAECAKKGSSSLGGSTRWMAPELIFAMAEDDGRSFELTTFSDVYAFASVCLEIFTGALPYPTRQNDVSVTVDVLRGIKPSHGAQLCVRLKDDGRFWEFLNRCWSPNVMERPSMADAVGFMKTVVQLPAD